MTEHLERWFRAVVSVMLGLTLAAPLNAAEAWTPDPLETLTPDSEAQYSATPDPIRIVAPRNGYASAPVLVRSLIDQRGQVSALRGPQGAVIQSDAVQVRYAAQQIAAREWSMPSYDALLDAPPADQEATPVWVTVRVPADAVPGKYTGRLTVGTLQIPVELTAGEYRISDPRDFVTHGYLVQSPDAVAWLYGVTPWSDDHLRLLESSLRLMGALGNKVAHITVLQRTLYGNEDGMLVFRREGEHYMPDFTFVDRYLDVYEKHVGPPQVLWLYIWDKFLAGGRDREPATEVTVTERRADGSLHPLKLPIYGTGAEQTWAAVVEGMRQRVQQRGWDPAIVMLGCPGDSRPTPQQVAFFNQLQPRPQWVVFSHWRGDPRARDGQRIISTDYGERQVDDPQQTGIHVGYGESPAGLPRSASARDLLGGDFAPQPGRYRDAGSFRGTVVQTSPLVQWRYMPYAVTTDDRVGYTRMGFDGWHAPRQPGGSHEPTLTRYARGWGNLWRANPQHMVAPGPQGAVATARFEMMREGIQETEARITLEKAVHSGRLPQDLTDEIRTFLRERHAALFGGSGRTLTAGDDWQQHVARLFDLAGRAQQQIE